MLTLLVLRHAKSSWGDPGLADHERPLNGRGRKAAKRIGHLLESEGLLPDIILASSALRVEQTVRIVSKASGYDGPVQVYERLYLADPDVYVDCLNELADATPRVMCVGHNPGLEALVSRHVGHAETMPTAALAELGFDVANWSDLETSSRAKLLNLWRVKDLPHSG